MGRIGRIRTDFWGTNARIRIEIRENSSNSCPISSQSTTPMSLCVCKKETK
jgi:hypothetical protein